MKRARLFLLVLLPLILFLVIRQRHMSTPQYAVRSVLIALENKDTQTLRKWTTKSTYKHMMTDGNSPGLYPVLKPAVQNWADWKRELDKTDPLFRNGFWKEKTVRGREFVTVLYALLAYQFVFAKLDGQWKLVSVREHKVVENEDANLWKWSEQQ